MFNTGEDTVKGRNLARDPRATLLAEDEEPPFSFVLARGRASLTRDHPDLWHWARRCAARYMGEDAADSFAERNAVPGELVVRLSVDRLVAVADVTE